MDMLSGEQISEAGLPDWRKLGQGLHARFVVADFAAGARFVADVATAAEQVGHAPEVRIGRDFVDVRLVSDDAICRDDAGAEHEVEWVTQQDLDLARRISDVAARHAAAADPAAVTAIELVLDTADAARVAPVWSSLLTGDSTSLGRGTIGDDVRDATRRVPILSFQRTEPHETPRQRFHLDVQLPHDVAESRIAAAVAAGGVVVDDSRAPRTTVIADPDGNRACVGTFQPPA
ncbi:VOC family protein [Intrasporangium sp. YIM S08009]|uniref:VOC family protein n=1 Tax=Intrasporangium zincisolvens TaxID=3080018 RepID=UPI002B05E40C|nr:VOC family protein [Intrasporangium sp. YIM S08009]